MIILMHGFLAAAEAFFGLLERFVLSVLSLPLYDLLAFLAESVFELESFDFFLL